MVKLYHEDGSFIGYVNREEAEFFCYENPACWFEETTDLILTKENIDVIMNMLDDIEGKWRLYPEEIELKEKLERWMIENEK